MALGDKWWHQWIPGLGAYLQLKDIFSGDPGATYRRAFNIGNQYSTNNLASQAESVLNSSRDELLADREHTEMREDTAYQRAVADMRATGLNPYTIGASGAPSSASSVGADTISTKLQVLGYILDLQNLNAKNRKITNDAIGNILGFVKKSK